MESLNLKSFFSKLLSSTNNHGGTSGHGHGHGHGHCKTSSGSGSRKSSKKGGTGGAGCATLPCHNISSPKYSNGTLPKSDQCTPTKMSTLPLNSSVADSGGCCCINDSNRNTPPTKPPRRDQVFRIELVCSPGEDIGITLDTVPANCYATEPGSGYDTWKCRHLKPGGASSSSSPGRRATASPSSTLKGGGISTYDTYSVNTDTGGSTREGIRQFLGQGTTFVKIVEVQEGGICFKDGRLKLNDEVIDINGKSVVKETANGAR